MAIRSVAGLAVRIPAGRGALWMAQIAVIGAYAITRDSHRANLETLASREPSSPLP